MTASAPIGSQTLRLHIGGTEPREGWKIFGIQPAPGVDFVGDCRDLSRFATATCAEIYASHVYEHLSHYLEVGNALREAFRILQPGGRLRVSVPDFEMLCRTFLRPGLDLEQRFYVMRVIFGGQTDPYDFHKIGLTWEFLATFLTQSGFVDIRRVEEFGLFNDCSGLRYQGQLISLNVEAYKPS
jgi:predicted SAM-dependent methyltransferase